MSSPRNTLGIVTWDFCPPKGGLGRSMQWMADALRECGWKIAILSPSEEKRSPFEKHHILYAFALGKRLQKWIDQNRIAQLVLPVGPGGIVLFRKPKHVALSVMVYHTYFQQSRAVPGQKWKQMFIPWEKKTIAYADQVLCFSEDTQRVLIDRYGISPGKVRLLPQLFDVHHWTEEECQKDPKSCVFVGRLDRRKGIRELIDAWSLVRRECPEALLTVIGSGPYAKAVDRVEGVQRIPVLSREHLQAVVRKSALAVCPSHLEGFGLAVAEAMASGTPVIATKVDGIMSLLDEESGVLVEPGDVRALSRAIIDTLHDRFRQRELARNAKKKVWDRFEPTRAKSALHEAMMSL